MSVKRVVIGIGLGIFIAAGIIACSGDSEPTISASYVPNDDTPVINASDSGPNWEKCRGLVGLHYGSMQRAVIIRAESRGELTLAAENAMGSMYTEHNQYRTLGKTLDGHERDRYDAVTSILGLDDPYIDTRGCLRHYEYMTEHLTDHKCWTSYKSAEEKASASGKYQTEITGVPNHAHRLYGEIALANYAILQNTAEVHGIELCSAEEWFGVSRAIYNSAPPSPQ